MSGSVFGPFLVGSARPFPIILVVDTSGSMGEHGKIEALNLAVREMIALFARENGLRAELQVAVITFGGEGARLHVPLTAARSLLWTDVVAGGSTPMGAAIGLLRGLLEDPERIPTRAYRPAVVLLSDGQPTDEVHFQRELSALQASKRAGKVSRFAVGVGADADERLLRAFLNSESDRVFRPETAREILEVLSAITRSITESSRSATPGAALSTTVVVGS